MISLLVFAFTFNLHVKMVYDATCIFWKLSKVHVTHDVAVH